MEKAARASFHRPAFKWQQHEIVRLSFYTGRTVFEKELLIAGSARAESLALRTHRVRRVLLSKFIGEVRNITLNIESSVFPLNTLITGSVRGKVSLCALTDCA